MNGVEKRITELSKNEDMPGKPLSPAMKDCIEKIKLEGTLVRWRGGYWTREKCPVKYIFDEIAVPEWYFTWNTIKALIDRDILTVSEVNYNPYDLVYYPAAVKLKNPTI